MKTNELSKYLEKLLVASKYRSILVDGPWGCGKTYEIRKFIKKNKRKCIYVSLFGLETIDEINTEIYQQSHKCRVRMAKISNVVSKAVSPVKYVSNVADALAFQLNEIDVSKIKKSKVVIIDDLERLSKQIEYKDLVGYFNKLLMNKVRIVCLVSLENLNDNQDRLNDFLEFREKVFDSCLTINQQPTDVFDDIFNKYSISQSDLVYPLFKNNIRMARRTDLLFGNVLKEIEKASVSKMVLTKYEILKVCAYTVLCVVGFNNDEPKIDDKKSFDGFCFKNDQDEYVKNIANGLAFYFKGKSKESDNYLQSYVKALIDYYRFMDFDPFLKSIKIKKPEETDILELSPFYLSDDGKHEYFDKFVSRVEGACEWNDLFERCVRAIYANTDLELPDKTIEKLAYLNANSQQKRYHTDRSSVAFDFFPGNDYTSQTSCQHFIDVYQKKYIKTVFENIVKEIETTVKNRNYAKAIDLFAEVQHSKNPIIKDMLIVNSFFIPDLSENITESEWSFCHKVANVANNLELKQEYINVAKRIYKASENKTDSLRTRLWALIYYGLNEVSFQEKDLLDKNGKKK